MVKIEYHQPTPWHGPTIQDYTPLLLAQYNITTQGSIIASWAPTSAQNGRIGIDLHPKEGKLLVDLIQDATPALLRRLDSHGLTLQATHHADFPPFNIFFHPPSIARTTHPSLPQPKNTFAFQALHSQEQDIISLPRLIKARPNYCIIQIKDSRFAMSYNL